MCVENFTLYFTSQGLDETALTDRKRTVFKVMQNLIDQMLTEENGKLLICIWKCICIFCLKE